MAVLTIASVEEEIVWRFVETAGGRLVVAVGSCWTNPLWAGGSKIWVDTIYTLGKHDMGWTAAARRPEPLAYGAAVSVREGVLLFGGQGPASLSKTILLFDGRSVRKAGELPAPTAIQGAALADGMFYLGAPSRLSPRSLRVRLEGRHLE
jgi:hypothetical protein